MKTARDHRNSRALGRGLVGIVAATSFVSTLTLISTEASALDINGLAAMALNYARNHGGYSAHRSGTQTAARRDRDSDDADDEDSGAYNRKSADTALLEHRPSAVRRSVEASATSPADSMVSLDRPLNDETASRPAR